MVVSVCPGRMWLEWAGALAVAVLAMQAWPAAATDSPRPTAEVGYSPLLDLFNLLDNLPDWLPGYTSSLYKNAWQQRFGLDERDPALFGAYAGFRRRTSALAQDHEATAVLVDRLFAGAEKSPWRSTGAVSV
ncbi:hypothetical protein [Stenotrophomonas geniculata]|uniref:hypothetical protein n=1 Tax=Stenotrophomonas geniculata TaxID=86188 RepID=UPI001EFB07B1|nr:hypothetical protein [Stenotrophomonas geniculata]MDH7548444.1 hypothetical protein [Stenotrophomonas geniculata]